MVTVAVVVLVVGMGSVCVSGDPVPEEGIGSKVAKTGPADSVTVEAIGETWGIAQAAFENMKTTRTQYMLRLVGGVRD
jgi:hypothetical protein